MQEWEGEPQRRRRWDEQVARQADGLLNALSLSPEEWKDPTKEWKRTSVPVAIDEFRQSVDRMVGARPDLPDQLDAPRGLPGMRAVRSLRETASTRRAIANIVNVRRS